MEVKMLLFETPPNGVIYPYNPEKYEFIWSTAANIPERLREIEKEYFVLYNKRTGHFEVHNTLNIGNTYCLTVPYKELDWRTVDLVKMTRSERAEKYIFEMDKRNDKLEKDAEARAIDFAGELAKDIWNYARQDHKSTECRLGKKVVR